MIKPLFIFLLFTAGNVSAYTVSFDNTAVIPSSYGVYAGTDYRIKLDIDKFFLSAEDLKICPWYCGITYRLYSAGVSRSYYFQGMAFYANAGLYLVKSNSRSSEYNENLYYYMMNRFGGGTSANTPNPSGFRNDTKNGYGAEFGARIPFADNYGMTFYYRHLQFFTNYVMYIQGGGYWHDPQTVKYNGFGFGLYYQF